MKGKVVVGMSGGVDSSVAAWLLKREGYDVIGVTMRTWQADEGKQERGCGGAQGEVSGEENHLEDITADAGRVAEILGIPYYVADFRKEFKCHVMDYFVQEYLKGRTPNPCIECNRHVKWEALLKKGRELGADYIATGHYAGIDRLPNGRYALRSCGAAKDQTYALYGLTQAQLAHTLMPVGAYTKEEIRSFAAEAGLPVAGKPDSQEICFLPDGDYVGFIEREAGGALPGPGFFVDAAGKRLGCHKGVIHYTIGQRRGLELPMGERVYVTEIRPDTNEVVIGRNEDLYVDEVFCGHVHYMAIRDLEEPMQVLGKIRYNHKGEYCRIEKLSDGSVRAVFEQPVRAATPGQSICFYDGAHVLGGGVITGGGKSCRT